MKFSVFVKRIIELVFVFIPFLFTSCFSTRIRNSPEYLVAISNCEKFDYESEAFVTLNRKIIQERQSGWIGKTKKEFIDVCGKPTTVVELSKNEEYYYWLKYQNDKEITLVRVYTQDNIVKQISSNGDVSSTEITKIIKECDGFSYSESLQKEMYEFQVNKQVAEKEYEVQRDRYYEAIDKDEVKGTVLCVVGVLGGIAGLSYYCATHPTPSK